MLLRITLVSTALFLAVGAYFLIGDTEAGGQKIEVEGAVLRVDVVSTPEDRARGLSGREHLADDEGLLFVHESEGYLGIWMKDMNFPIDIVWMDQDLVIVDIKHSVSPDTYPEAFHPREPAQYVLEANAGWANDHKVDIGDKVHWAHSSDG